MFGAIGLPELLIIMMVALIAFGGRGIAGIGRVNGTASNPTTPTGDMVFESAFARIPARDFEVGSRPGAMAELLGLGVDGVRWTQVAVLVVGTVVAENSNLLFELSPDRFEPSVVVLTLALPGFFIFAAIIAVRSFQNSVSAAVACGVIYALFRTAAQIALMQANDGFDNMDALRAPATVALVSSTFDMFALQFAVAGRHRWIRMSAALVAASLAATYVAIGVWTGQWDPEVLASSPFVFQTVALSAVTRTATFWLARALSGEYS